MRNEREAARAGQNEVVLKATSAGHAEITELRATIQALRDELESERGRHVREQQQILQTARGEQQQLQQMIVALREQLEAAHGR